MEKRLVWESSSCVELQERTAAQVARNNREPGYVLKIWNQPKKKPGFWLVVRIAWNIYANVLKLYNAFVDMLFTIFIDQESKQASTFPPFHLPVICIHPYLICSLLFPYLFLFLPSQANYLCNICALLEPRLPASWILLPPTVPHSFTSSTSPSLPPSSPSPLKQALRPPTKEKNPLSCHYTPKGTSCFSHYCFFLYSQPSIKGTVYSLPLVAYIPCIHEQSGSWIHHFDGIGFVKYSPHPGGTFLFFH